MCGVFGPFCDIFMAVLVMFVKVFGHNAAGFQCNLNVIPARPGRPDPFTVIPAKAGIHILPKSAFMDSRLRGNDGSRGKRAEVGRMAPPPHPPSSACFLKQWRN